MSIPMLDSVQDNEPDILYKDHNGLCVHRVTDPATMRVHYVLEPVGSELRFQNGPVPEVGLTGWTNEACIAAVMDRLRRLNSHLPCSHNELAIQALDKALSHLEQRTYERIERNVEGTEAA